jgi:hypothetical protein
MKVCSLHARSCTERNGFDSKGFLLVQTRTELHTNAEAAFAEIVVIGRKP